MNRRTFLSFAAGAGAGMMITPIPWKLTDDISIWTQNWQWNPKVPKRAVYFAEMASKLDPAGSGVRVALVDGVPVGLGASKDHPLSGGGVSALAAAEVGLLMSPARVRQPLVRTAAGLEPISWDDAEALLAEKLGQAKGDVAMVSGDDTGTANEVFAALMHKLSGAFYMMPGEAQSAHKALEMLGAEGRLAYDIEGADYVLLLGADALESSGTAVRNARAFSQSHPSGQDATAKYVYAGPVLNNTAVVCDQWIQARPGAAASVALGLAHVLMERGATAQAKGLDAFRKDVAANYSPARIERETGVRADTLRKLAAELAAARRPLVIAGSEFGQGAGARALMAALGLNAMLGRVNVAGGVKLVPEAPVVVDGAPSVASRYSADLVPFLKKLAEGQAKADVLLVYDANPAYALPQAELMAQAVRRAGFTVSFSSFMDETAELADLVLPSSMALERYDDVYTPYGAGQAVYSLNRPLARPAFDTRASADVLLSVARRLDIDLGYVAFKDVLRAKAVALGADWNALKRGAAWTSARTLPLVPDLTVAAAPAPRAVGEGLLALAPVAKHNLGSAKVALPPYNAVTVRNCDLMVQMNAKTARMSGVADGQTVRLTGPGGEMTARVHVTEKVMTGVVAAPLGFGHTAWDEYSRGLGDNAYKVLAAADDPETGLSVWSDTRVNIATA
ncbi:menaquinone reductase molybdopterin-binding-like subunit QrcB [Desulfocurvus vexinensis]|uniref:menaquinone reductase molybdopterin-binding-like subunit QrcB n=1 Tax=Desulfocurvus vexinensis TaxID=399548 RepID=UPI0004BA2BC0|nr:menaquinone reductase molybdopterin-binding-like subunit QrcB [Desulfocurvus vexinensis]